MRSILCALLFLVGCKSSPATVDDIVARAKDHKAELEQLRKDMAADGIRAVGYKSVTGASGASCGVVAGSDWQCTMPGSSIKTKVGADDVPELVGMKPARYKSYLKLLDAVKAQDASVQPTGILDVYVVVRSDIYRGLTWCPGSPASHATNCHKSSRKYTAIEDGWYAWE
jgi:hypothetical protein